MLRKLKDTFVQILFTLLSLYLTFLLLRYPARSLDYAGTGLLLWFRKMIPTLFPFMILSGVMVRMNLTENFARFFHPLFHKIWGTSLNGSYVILMGMLCGFPMGARVVGELCRAGKLSEEEGAYLLAFCNNIGPIYFLSFVTGALSLSGCLPFLIMYGVPLCYGVFLHLLGCPRIRTRCPVPAFHTGSLSTKASRSAVFLAASLAKPARPSLLAAIDDSIVSGLIGIGKLGGYMVFFNLLNILFLPFASPAGGLAGNPLSGSFPALCNCLLEITSGISRVGKEGGYMVLILLPFGGLSCMAQTYSMIKGTNLSISRYFLHKSIQTAATALIYAFCAAFSYTL
ncbi:MAG: hypothetical protein NC341_02655 [Blautia sp.]|nr:hypothetical protein [Blautia sp.]MCM1200518.1 hypothetical protein [Bacteroides fragilis]